MKKRFYKSKIFWGGVSSLLMSLYFYYSGNIPEAITSLTTGLFIIVSRVTTDKPLKW